MKRWFRPKLKRQDKIPQTSSSTDFEKVLLENGTEIGGPGSAGGGPGEGGTSMPDTRVDFSDSNGNAADVPEVTEEPAAIHGSVCFIQESPYRIHKVSGLKLTELWMLFLFIG